jgi:hypothetical protein
MASDALAAFDIGKVSFVNIILFFLVDIML